MVNGPACKAMSVKWEVSVRPSFEIALIFKSDWITQAQLHSRVMEASSSTGKARSISKLRRWFQLSEATYQDFSIALYRYFKPERWLSTLLCQSLKLGNFVTAKKDVWAKQRELSVAKFVTSWIQSQREAAKYQGVYDRLFISRCLYVEHILSWGLFALRCSW